MDLGIGDLVAPQKLEMIVIVEYFFPLMDAYLDDVTSNAIFSTLGSTISIIIVDTVVAIPKDVVGATPIGTPIEAFVVYQKE